MRDGGEGKSTGRPTAASGRGRQKMHRHLLDTGARGGRPLDSEGQRVRTTLVAEGAFLVCKTAVGTARLGMEAAQSNLVNAWRLGDDWSCTARPGSSWRLWTRFGSCHRIVS